MRGFWKRVLVCLLSAGMVCGLGGVSVMAAEADEDAMCDSCVDEAEETCDSCTGEDDCACCCCADDCVSMMIDAGKYMSIQTFAGETYNFGHLDILCKKAASDNTISLGVGETVEIIISPYYHDQYHGCRRDNCGDDTCSAQMGGTFVCWYENMGCCCDRTPSFETGTVTLDIADSNIVSGTGEVSYDAGDVNAVGDMTNGTITLTAESVGTTDVTVGAQLYNWLDTTVTYTITVTDSATGNPDTGNPDTGEPDSGSDTLPESDHNYAGSEDKSWTYKLDDAPNGVYVMFDERTEVEDGSDFIYVYDGNGNEIGKYTGTSLAGATLYVPTAAFTIRLTSDYTLNEWGFRVIAVEAAGDTIDLGKVGTVDDPLAPVMAGTTEISADVQVNGVSLIQGTDFLVSADTSVAGKTVEATVTGIGSYGGTLTTHVYVYDEEHLAEPASLEEDAYTLLRYTTNSSMGETIGESTIPFDEMEEAYASSITEITLSPIEEDGTPTDTNGLAYPNAPKEITIYAANDDFYTSGNEVHFYRSEKNPVVYVMAGHGTPYVDGKKTYPQTQAYKVTVKATGYEDAVGTTTYYTGTSNTFSIILDTDGDMNTTSDRQTVKTWTAEELEKKMTFANGSSQCGMTGFRTFTSMGVALEDLVKEAGVTVSDNDYFEIDTSDSYGNRKTYQQLFGATRYFMSGIYDPAFPEVYQNAVDSDSEAGYDTDIRVWLGEYAYQHKTIVKPRLFTSYNEDMIYGDDLASAVLPTEANTTFNSLVSFENQFRFVYGIEVVQEDCTVTFDTNGGSDVASQTVLSHHMTSTENTTMWSSFWANSLIIYRGLGPTYNEPATELKGTETIAKPSDPSKAGYAFGGWYTDKNCTDGNEFDFTANDGKVDENTTLYAKWLKADIEKIGSTWTYTVNGEPDYTYTGFASNSNGNWYVENGKVTFAKNGVLKDTAGAIGSKGDWYYVVGSKVQTSYTGVADYKNDNGWWYINQGKVDFSANTVAKNKNGWWYIANGKVDFTHNGVDKNKNGWWYVTGGKVQFGYTGVSNYKNANGWWYIKDGKVDFTYRGIASNKNGSWYVSGGKVQFGYSGNVTFGGKTYTVRNGKVS